MISLDEEALECDLAETYHIFDYRQLPVLRVAVFSCGLRDDSRIKMKMSHQSVSPQILLLASANDKLGLLLWSKTKDGQKGIRRPPPLVQQLMKMDQRESQLSRFASGADFDRQRNDLLLRVKGG